VSAEGPALRRPPEDGRLQGRFAAISLAGMQMIRNRMHGRVAAIVAVAVTLSVGGMGTAQGSSRPPDAPANAAKTKKKSYAFNADWKTGPQDVIGEGERGTDVEGTDEAKLRGLPFAKKALLDELSRFTYNHPDQIPRMDYSGTYHITFDADVYNRGMFLGTFSGFYDYSVDSEGNPTAAPTGRITGGTREFKGARGSFTVLDLHYTSNDPAKQAGRWKGSIRY
jgi:hypothetical protein